LVVIQGPVNTVVHLNKKKRKSREEQGGSDFTRLGPEARTGEQQRTERVESSDQQSSRYGDDVGWNADEPGQPRGEWERSSKSTQTTAQDEDTTARGQ
jgi:hypothetical protein